MVYIMSGGGLSEYAIGGGEKRQSGMVLPFLFFCFIAGVSGVESSPPP